VFAFYFCYRFIFFDWLKFHDISVYLGFDVI